MERDYMKLLLYFHFDRNWYSQKMREEAKYGVVLITQKRVTFLWSPLVMFDML